MWQDSEIFYLWRDSENFFLKSKDPRIKMAILIASDRFDVVKRKRRDKRGIRSRDNNWVALSRQPFTRRRNERVAACVRGIGSILQAFSSETTRRARRRYNRLKIVVVAYKETRHDNDPPAPASRGHQRTYNTRIIFDATKPPRKTNPIYGKIRSGKVRVRSIE